MQRSDEFGATPEGQYKRGSKSSGDPATVVGPEEMNAIVEEICTPIESEGFVIDPARTDQLYEAIKKMIADRIAPLWSTGDAKLTLKVVADDGWIMADDGTIGNAGSGATTRANADCEALFTLLWDNVSDANAPVSGGRGASALADWVAAKTIGLTKTLGRALAVSGAGTGLTARALGETLGEETHLLSIGEMPAHTHSLDHSAVTRDVSQAGGFNDTHASTTDSVTGSAGGGEAHNNMQPTSFFNVMIKL